MMFKLFWAAGQRNTICTIRKSRTFKRLRRNSRPPVGRLKLLLLLLLIGATGCRTLVPPLPKVDLQEPGWTLREGQAVWHLPKSAQEIAGEVLLASRSDGRAFVQFIKPPFPLVIAQMTSNRWEVEFPPQNRRYAGRGKPPKRLIWLYLPRVLCGEAPPKNWIWRQDNNRWHLENSAQRESLDGYFNP